MGLDWIIFNKPLPTDGGRVDSPDDYDGPTYFRGKCVAYALPDPLASWCYGSDEPECRLDVKNATSIYDRLNFQLAKPDDDLNGWGEDFKDEDKEGRAEWRDTEEDHGMWKTGDTTDEFIICARKLIKEGDMGRIIIQRDNELVYHYHIRSHHKWCGSLPIGEVFA